jgi:hypothetical protein
LNEINFRHGNGHKHVKWIRQAAPHRCVIQSWISFFSSFFFFIISPHELQQKSL